MVIGIAGLVRVEAHAELARRCSLVKLRVGTDFGYHSRVTGRCGIRLNSCGRADGAGGFHRVYATEAAGLNQILANARHDGEYISRVPPQAVRS
jgi:hypothetical protein